MIDHTWCKHSLSQFFCPHSWSKRFSNVRSLKLNCSYLLLFYCFILFAIVKPLPVALWCLLSVSVFTGLSVMLPIFYEYFLACPFNDWANFLYSVILYMVFARVSVFFWTFPSFSNSFSILSKLRYAVLIVVWTGKSIQMSKIRFSSFRNDSDNSSSILLVTSWFLEKFHLCQSE